MFSEENISNAFNKRFGTQIQLKKEQVEIITALTNKKSCFGVLPTGFGKSLCYLTLPTILQELHAGQVFKILIISPLVALLSDQEQYCQKLGVPVLNLSRTTFTLKDAQKSAIILAAPESLIHRDKPVTALEKAFQDPDFSSQLAAVVFDEVHCISTWGADFRKSYFDVCSVSRLTTAPLCLLTGTADAKIKRDTFSALGLRDEDVLQITVLPDRPNIFLSFDHHQGCTFETTISWIVSLIEEKQEKCPKALIYCPTIQSCNDMYDFFKNALGPKAYMGGEAISSKRFIAKFHAEVGEITKQLLLTKFRQPNGMVRVMMATSAFGMGVNIQDIHTVVHWGLPRNYVSYWQEIGRAGRNGLPAEAYLYVGQPNWAQYASLKLSTDFKSLLGLPTALSSNTPHSKGTQTPTPLPRIKQQEGEPKAEPDQETLHRPVNCLRQMILINLILEGMRNTAWVHEDRRCTESDCLQNCCILCRINCNCEHQAAVSHLQPSAFKE